jgi:hypothetical protein
MPVGRFTAEGQRLIHKLGYRGAEGVEVRHGLLVFAQVFNVTERGGVKILEVYTDAFAVPLNPAQIRGKRAVVGGNSHPVTAYLDPRGSVALRGNGSRRSLLGLA